MEKIIKIICIFLILSGIFLRVHKIGTVPSGLFMDEIALGINAKTLAETGTDEYGKKYPFGIESFTDYKMPGYVYMDAAFYKLFGPSITTIRLPSVITSILSVFLLGLLAMVLFPGRQLVWLGAMSALAISPFHIHFGRTAYETMAATFFLLVFMASLAILLFRKRMVPMFILGVTALIAGSWCYPAPRLIIPVFIMAYLIYMYIADARIGNGDRPNIRILWIYLAISLLTFIPNLFNPDLDKRTLGYVLSGSGDSALLKVLAKLLFTVVSWLRTFNFEFLFLKGDIFGFRNGTTEAGVLLPFTAVFFGAGIIALFRNISLASSPTVFLTIMLIVFGLPSALTSIVPYGPRFLPMTAPLALINGTEK